MEYRKLLRRFRWFCGGVFLCLAYTPLLFKGKVHRSVDDVAMVTLGPLYHLCYGNCATAEIAANRVASSLLSLSSAKSSGVFSTAFLCNPAVHFGIDNNREFVASLKTAGNGVYVPGLSPSIPARENVTLPSVSFQNKHKVDIAGHSDAVLVKGKVKSNFYADARQLGIPSVVVDAVVRKMSQKLNFRSSLKKGDRFEVIYNRGKKLLYARVITKNSDVAIYRFSDGQHKHSYFFENGDLCGAPKADDTFGKPLNGKIVVSDGYGPRRHPISGIRHFHTGVDLAAGLGEPIYAIQDGVVTRASRYGGYGNCIDIEHASGYSSRYAHLSRFKVVVGTRVRKGQIIGTVGITGSTTGPHLHLELACNRKVVNPFSVVKLSQPKRNVVGKLREFNALKKRISAISSRYKYKYG